MRISVFGSTGTAGRLIVAQALAQGHDVTAFLRTPSKLQTEHQHLRVVQGDVFDEAAVDEAVRDQEAILCALGVGTGSKLPVLSQGTRNILAAMQRFEVRRLVCLSSYGVGDSYRNAPSSMKVFFRLVVRRAYEDKEAQEDFIRQSDVEWVIVRPTRFTNGTPRGAYRVGEHLRLGPFTTLARADAASFMLKQLTDDTWLYKHPELSY